MLVTPRNVGLTLILVVALVVGLPTVAFAAECDPISQQTTGCPTDVKAGLGDGQVTIGGSTTTPGSGGSDGSGGADDDTASAPIDPNAQCAVVVETRCLIANPGHGGEVVVQPITLADIAYFRPDPGVDRMEPNGWMIVGLDTNFYSTGGVQVHDGTLLGQPASVRFTPVLWHWTYGDGTGATRSTAGGTWASQGVAEFDATSTSHVYGAPGTYYIDLTIDFAAEYRFAGMPWTDIAGTLPVPANRLVATAGAAKTVLVERECTVNPSGPGC